MQLILRKATDLFPGGEDADFVAVVLDANGLFDETGADENADGPSGDSDGRRPS